MSTPASQHRDTHGKGRPDRSLVTLVQDLPDLTEVEEGTGELSAMERANFAAAEAAIDTFQASGWAAGQALAVIAKGAYHRQTHPTFPEYLWDRWGLKPSPAYRLMEGWHLAARIAPLTGGKGVTGSHITSLMPLAKHHGENGEEVARAAFAGAIEAVKASGRDRKLTAALLDAAVAAVPSPAELPEEQEKREKVVAEAARDAVTSQIREAAKPSETTEETEQPTPPAPTSVRLAAQLPPKLAETLDEWAGRLSAGLSLPQSREGVLARIVQLALEQPDSLVAVARRIEAESAEKVGGARRWTWSPEKKPRGYIRIAEEKAKGHTAPAGQDEVRCYTVLGQTTAGLPLCDQKPTWRITDHPTGPTALVTTAFFCGQHLPDECSPPGRWTG